MTRIASEPSRVARTPGYTAAHRWMDTVPIFCLVMLYTKTHVNRTTNCGSLIQRPVATPVEERGSAYNQALDHVSTNPWKKSMLPRISAKETHIP